MIEFDWDPDKDETNFRKHGVRFREAASVFGDSGRLETLDRSHSHHEARQRTLGWSSLARLLVVITSERHHRLPRIISARRATKREHDDYARRR